MFVHRAADTQAGFVTNVRVRVKAPLTRLVRCRSFAHVVNPVRLTLTRLLGFGKIMSELRPEESSAAPALEVAFSSQGVVSLQIRFIIDQFPRSPVRSCEGSASRVLSNAGS